MRASRVTSDEQRLEAIQHEEEVESERGNAMSEEKDEKVVEVLGHRLPSLLVNLIEEGKWVHNQVFPMDALNKLITRVGLTPIKVAMAMYNVNTMENATISRMQYFSSIDNLEARKNLYELYSEASSRYLGKEIDNEGILDLDKALFITDNWDEESIYFDYRKNPENPSIKAFVSGNRRIVYWEMIAPDFETFARELGLID